MSLHPLPLVRAPQVQPATCRVAGCTAPIHNHQTGLCDAHHETYLDRAADHTTGGLA